MMLKGTKWIVTEGENGVVLLLYVENDKSIAVGLNDNGEECDKERIKILEHIKFSWQVLKGKK
jgi:hypothetical protein